MNACNRGGSFFARPVVCAERTVRARSTRLSRGLTRSPCRAGGRQAARRLKLAAEQGDLLCECIALLPQTAQFVHRACELLFVSSSEAPLLRRVGPRALHLTD